MMRLGEPIEVAGRDAGLELRLDQGEDLGHDAPGHGASARSRRRDLRVTMISAPRGRRWRARLGDGRQEGGR